MSGGGAAVVSALHISDDQKPTSRRSGNYQPSMWDFNFIHSLNNPYVGEEYVRRAADKKEQVKKMLEWNNEREPSYYFELIDDLQRLGLLYLFESQVKLLLANLYNNIDKESQPKDDNLYTTALKFRLFRQYGFHISQDTLSKLISKEGELEVSHYEDTKGILQLYEACYLSVEGEDMLESARKSTRKFLEKNNTIGNEKMDKYIGALVDHALALPTFWRVNRVEARWFIDIYQTKPDKIDPLLELAKLDYNLLQATYQQDLKHMSRWWRGTHIMENMKFTRDCMVSCFLWTVGMLEEPQYSYIRRTLTKIIIFITVIDDVYDIYGTLNELELFTDAILRWDINAVENFPHYLKVCFLATYNGINEVAYDALKEQGVDTIQYLKKVWGDLCKAYLQEAKWYYSGYKPTLEEYINNGWVSITTPVCLLHAYIGAANPISKEELEGIANYHNIIQVGSTLFRYADDLGTSSDEMKRGDVPKAIQCHMIHTGASEKEARSYIKLLVQGLRTKLYTAVNQDSPFSEMFIKITMNFLKSAQCVYEFGDGHCNLDAITRERIATVFFDPIPIEDLK